jgi:hypothetical protein
LALMITASALGNTPKSFAFLFFASANFCHR